MHGAGKTRPRAAIAGGALAAAVVAVAPLGAAPAPVDFGSGAYRRVVEFLGRLEVADAPPPPWYRDDLRPVLTFVQISDIHLRASVEPILLEALAFVRERVRPAFVLFTGDGPGGSAVERQRHLKDLIATNLPSPAFFVRGDNWARNFAAVFGPTRWSFACAGVRLIGTGLDRDAEGMGIGLFEDDTLAWLREEIRRAAGHPVIYIQHENIQPPLFLHAGEIHRLLEGSPNVVLALAGHIHFDLESKLDRVLHIACPGLGPSPRHGFKVIQVYPRGILIRTVERGVDPEGTIRYRFVGKHQGVEIPEALGAAVRGPARIEDFRALPARETVFDAGLRGREVELIAPFLIYAQRIGRLEELMRIVTGAREPEKTAEPAGVPAGR
ncbi:MAG: hypothetical protein JXP34_25280 [Planctomycetes bacterium]|nr:hypothetical protein [Planctomycetota bacterium]